MYEELVKALHEGAEFLECSTPGIKNSFAKMCHNAADAIEGLSALVDASARDSAALLMRVADLIPRWIPVTERLPEEDGMYLVHGEWASGRKVTDTCEFYVHDGYFRAAWNFTVTHWQPIPQPPKEETHGD